MNEKVDYTKVLDDLIVEREKLDAMIGWVKVKLGQNGTESNTPTLQVTKTEPMRFPRLAPDAFFKMTVSDAIKEYLGIVKRPQTAREITDALKAGGLAFKAKNLYQTVFPTLGRMAEGKEVDKLGDGTWGLAEWYSSGRRATSAAASASASEEADS
jgi:hypothetical protein